MSKEYFLCEDWEKKPHAKVAGKRWFFKMKKTHLIMTMLELGLI